MTDATRPLWTAAEAAAATSGRLEGGADWTASGISIDTRTLEPGDLFIALSGEKADGHEFVATAFQKGAAAALVDRPMPGGPCLVVDDVRSALIALGQAARNRTSARILAVTGSVGKTSAKEALRLALGRGQATHASVGSFNNDLGVPISLARMPADSEFAVLELGMNHSGELLDLSRQVRPHVALITNVEQAHSAYFPSVEAIADAKAEVFAGLNGEAIAVLNLDSPHFARLRAAAVGAGAKRILTFGMSEAADAHPLKTALHEDCSCITAMIGSERITYKVGAPGRHWVMNSLAVLLTAQAAGADLGLAGLALADMMPVKGRGLRHKVALGAGAIFWVVDESYNANPASMRAALDTLSTLNIDSGDGARNGSRGRRIAVLGDMKELGDAAPKLHAALADSIRAADVDLVITVGELMRHLASALPKTTLLAAVDTAAQAAEKLKGVVRPNDVVMIKGSQSMGMVKVVNTLLALGSKTDAQAANA
ncbi:UDP-N-acetylmuramoyl-tripeptide--D-alanyl-D-alanine ligase [Govanella unica]|uniref:UDP-N-acetylmuramoyl-tripeptide--D-alanyl-D-alanine ligase n=1 Tax=Govanella unica TaxID=2975056 RepID=A0A9X3U0E6_9PROT|nr:UDP-N-acetylmuramoyl-tripeptide--D-alanyl-D-alanine ligase [Govania unica]MDA5195074.1 UDP-N-acetylmuramoyl-tripeptide--D-alanyl-D-alanine ligase [Govania unica]